MKTPIRRMRSPCCPRAASGHDAASAMRDQSPDGLRLVEHADLADEEKWLISTMLICGDARIEEVPGLGLKVILPPSRRH
jgi:hypothetical protein